MQQIPLKTTSTMTNYSKHRDGETHKEQTIMTPKLPFTKELLGPISRDIFLTRLGREEKKHILTPAAR